MIHSITTVSGGGLSLSTSSEEVEELALVEGGNQNTFTIAN